MPPVGTTLEIGTPAFRIDNHPNLAFPLKAPMFRPLFIGSEGPDVADLNRTLHGLGYAAPDGSTYTGQTERGLDAWRADSGQGVKDGVELGDLQSGIWPQTVKEVLIDLGASVAVGQAILAVSSGGNAWEVELFDSEAERVAVGDEVLVEGTDGRGGRVESLRVDTRNGTQQMIAVVSVPIGPREARTASLVVITDRLDSALVVPAGAIGLNGGATVVVTDRGVTAVTVRLVQDGLAAISGNIAEGDVVYIGG